LEWNSGLKILILSNFYEPDLSAGSFRTTALVSALKKDSSQANITVITTAPKRYGSYVVEAKAFERRGRLSILRIATPIRKQTLVSQLLNFLYFAWVAQRSVRGEKFDLVFATSSRLMTAVLGAWISWRSGSKLYLDIRDIFSESIRDLILPFYLRPLLGVLYLMEVWALKRANSINLVSPGFLDYF